MLAQRQLLYFSVLDPLAGFLHTASSPGGHATAARGGTSQDIHGGANVVAATGHDSSYSQAPEHVAAPWQRRLPMATCRLQGRSGHSSSGGEAAGRFDCDALDVGVHGDCQAGCCREGGCQARPRRRHHEPRHGKDCQQRGEGQACKRAGDARKDEGAQAHFDRVQGRLARRALHHHARIEPHAPTAL